MRRREQVNETTSAATTHPSSPLPPPTAAASRAEVAELAEQIADIREQFRVFSATMTTQVSRALDNIDASLNASREEAQRLDGLLHSAVGELQQQVQKGHEALGAVVQDRTAALAVDAEVQRGQLEARLRTHVAEVAAQQQSVSVELGSRLAQVIQHLEVVTQRLTAHEQQVAQRDTLGRQEHAAALAALEERASARHVELQQQQAQVVANIQAQMASAVEAADVRLNNTTAELNDRLASLAEREERTGFTVMQIQERIGEIDAKALDELRERVSSVAGEGALIRIEMDRLTGSIDDRFDRMQLRLTGMESKVEADHDVSLTVQSDRLDELERALQELDPVRFVTRDEMGLGEPSPTLHVVHDLASGGD